MSDKFLFGISPEILLIILFAFLIIMILLARRGSKGIAAMAASIPLFWLLSKKFGHQDKGLEEIRREYEARLEELRNEFDLKLETIKKDLKIELTKNQLKAEKVTEEIAEVNLETKKVLENATPDELEELARGLLSVSKKK
ncbi:hypothetical protein GF337_13435 [candidate division KSB1 bacterium]|nr:hypothetical protein [candidate division KSB1 bacterium]